VVSCSYSGQHSSPLSPTEQAPFDAPRWIQIGGERHALGGPLIGLIHGQIMARPPNSPTVPTGTRQQG